MKIVAVIPARYGSTRFRAKPLAMIGGRPMIQRVYENAASCSIIDRVIVATDHPEIQRAVESFGGESAMTAGTHETGTDRIAEVVRGIGADIVVNAQGDEPLLPPEAMADAVRPLIDDRAIPMGTLKTRFCKGDDPADPNIVKVVTNSLGFALYFSRSLIPHPWSPGQAGLFRHIGLYVYRKEFLLKLTSMDRTPLERSESLEQLRALERGYPIKVIETDYHPVGVDIPADVAKVETILNVLNSGPRETL